MARGLLALLFWLAFVPALPAADTLVDLELVLAVDASASVDDDEFRLQLQGIAAAFRDPAVIKAISSGPAKRIAVSLLVWAEATYPKDFSGWSVLASEEDARRFAEMAASFPRRVTGGTGLGDGIAHALRAIDGNGLVAPRSVVDVSGDGIETAPRDYSVMLPAARAMAIARGVTLNGLAIRNEVPDLDRYYRESLQVGPGSFVMSAATYADFAEAMRRKLLREIDVRPSVSEAEIR
ncbi:MAG: DUF1194 domain-containing protein [Parvibaculaceae bacterium]